MQKFKLIESAFDILYDGEDFEAKFSSKFVTKNEVRTLGGEFQLCDEVYVTNDPDDLWPVIIYFKVPQYKIGSATKPPRIEYKILFTIYKEHLFKMLVDHFNDYSIVSIDGNFYLVLKTEWNDFLNANNF